MTDFSGWTEGSNAFNRASKAFADLASILQKISDTPEWQASKEELVPSVKLSDDDAFLDYERQLDSWQG